MGGASQAGFCLGSARRSLGWETVCPSPWIGTHGPQHLLQDLVWVLQVGLEGLGGSHSTSNSAFLEENSTTYPNCKALLPDTWAGDPSAREIFSAPLTTTATSVPTFTLRVLMMVVETRRRRKRRRKMVKQVMQKTRVAVYTHTGCTLHNFGSRQPSALRLSSLYLE
nr:uncharacterized protein LOC131742202 [Kogia breviceps]